MPEEILFKFERSMDRNEIAEYLRSAADRLEGDGELRLEANDQSVDLSVPGRPTFEVKAERETSGGSGPAELSIEFELEWDEGQSDDASGDSTLSI